jgi:hypothetical protein
MTDSPNHGWQPPERVWISKGDDRFPEDDTWTDTKNDEWPEYVRADLVAAREAAAAQAMREACSKRIQGIVNVTPWTPEAMREAARIIVDYAPLPAPGALDAMLAEARREGMRKAAGIARQWPTGITTDAQEALAAAILAAIEKKEPMT